MTWFLPTRGFAGLIPASFTTPIQHVVWVGLVVFCSGCAQESNDRELLELEGLSFVPAQRLVLKGFEATRWANCSLDRAILIDRFELSTEKLEQFKSALVDPPIVWATEDLGKTGAGWPAPLSFADANAVAAARGMRLPTPQEWLHVALGGRDEGYPFPWGTTKAFCGGNTLELEMGRPTPVGSFLGGRSRPYGCYDLLGNLWEWVDGSVAGYDDVGALYMDGTNESPAVGPEDGLTSVMGGGYDAFLMEIFGLSAQGELRFLARQQDRGFRSPLVGARMCADAETYLMRFAGQWGEGVEVEERVRRVGARWAESGRGFALRRLLDELAAREGAPEELSWLAQGAAQ